MKMHYDLRTDSERDGQTRCGLDIGRDFRSLRYRREPLHVTKDYDQVTCQVCNPSLRRTTPKAVKKDTTPKWHWKHPLTKRPSCTSNRQYGYMAMTEDTERVTCTRCQKRVEKFKEKAMMK